MGRQITRRSLFGAAGALPFASPCLAGPHEALDAVGGYWESLARPDGYAWPDNPHGCLTVVHAAIASYRLLGREAPRKTELAEFLRGAYPLPPGRKKDRPLRRFDYEQIQSLDWLGESIESFRAEVSAWTRPDRFPKYYEFNSNPVLRQETGAILCRRLLGLGPTPEWREYIAARRRANGSFNNTPGSDGDGHVVNTLWGLLAMRALEMPVDRAADAAAVEWIRSCQAPGGGFRYAPRAAPGGIDRVIYTWAALLALQLLGALPADAGGARRYLLSAWNADGGFGDRPGRASNPLATHQALEALSVLGPLSSLAGVRRGAAPHPPASIPPHLKVFSIQIEAPGSGNPREAVAAAQALGIHLWGAKDAAPGWIERARQIARAERAAVTFFVSNEEYGTYVTVPGIGTYSHLADITAPAGSDFGASLADKDHPVPWQTFLRSRVDPLRRASGNNVWQFNDNEELSRVLLDQAVEEGTFSAISTFHFGSGHFLASQPFLNCYRDVMPFVGLQDSHTQTWWWMEYLTGFRTLFLAAEPTWAGWLEALRRNWVVAIRHDAVTNFETHVDGAANQVRRFVLERAASWRWWGDDPRELLRPWAMLTAIGPGDEFDELRPPAGTIVRVRCWMDTQPFGTPKIPVTELVSLEIDGGAVETSHVIRPAEKGGRGDNYYEWHLPGGQAGRHTAAAVVRMIRGGAVKRLTADFTAL